MRRLRGPVRAHAQHGETAGGAVSSDGLALAPQTPPSRSGSLCPPCDRYHQASTMQQLEVNLSLPYLTSPCMGVGAWQPS